MRYTQDENYLIKGPGLPESGSVAVGVRELEAAFEAGKEAIRKQTATFMLCDCGRPLSIGTCRICDNDD